MRAVESLWIAGMAVVVLSGCVGVKAGGEAAARRKLAFDLGSGVSMEFVLIPPGSFMMGSQHAEDRPVRSEEKPLHKVILTKPFYLGRYEVTQEQWQAVMGTNPSRFKGPKNPVECVSWDDCQTFLRRLAEKAPGKKFRLTREAEWEYACRAGSGADYCYGDDASDLADYAWYSGNSGKKTHPVGKKKPNAWGLHDMHGNVWEWCEDWLSDSYASGEAVDPTGPPSGVRRVVRGGDVFNSADGCRAAFRDGASPDFRLGAGLRVALDVP